MPTLLDAYKATYPRMKPQIQGTCGIYSFWYASILLNHLNAAKYPDVPFPRACHGAGDQASMREVAKAMGSGQGEVLSGDEMVQLVSLFAFDATPYVPGGTGADTRDEFISAHLKANRPVLFAYLCGDGPVTRATAKGTAQDAFGPHWSLIVDESRILRTYTYINPHEKRDRRGFGLQIPQLTTKLRSKVLASNADVDSVKYDRFWYKQASHDLRRAPATDFLKPYKRYDLGARAANQSLNNVLIAIG